MNIFNEDGTINKAAIQKLTNEFKDELQNCKDPQRKKDLQKQILKNENLINFGRYVIKL